MGTSLKICEICQEEFLSKNGGRKICYKKECSRLRTHKYATKYINQNNNNKPDMIICKECGLKCNRQISPAHLKSKHNLTLNEYKEKYNLTTNDLFCEDILNKYSERVKGDKNPAYQHGGKFSPFSKKFVNYDEDKLKEVKEKAYKNRETPDKKSTSIDYWVLKGFSKKEAKKKLSERQRTFNLQKCVKKYGEIEGLRVWEERQNKWQTTLKSKSEEETIRINKAKTSKSDYSSSKSELEILQYLRTLGFESESQYVLRVNDRHWVYDIRINNNIIEYNGDFYHCNPMIYTEDYYNKKIKMTAKEKWAKDKLKLQDAKDRGHEVYVIWENDYKNNKEKVLNECVAFLGGSTNE